MVRRTEKWLAIFPISKCRPKTIIEVLALHLIVLFVVAVLVIPHAASAGWKAIGATSPENGKTVASTSQTEQPSGSWWPWSSPKKASPPPKRKPIDYVLIAFLCIAVVVLLVVVLYKTIWPRGGNLGHDQTAGIVLEKQPPLFPRNLFSFQEYDGGKCLVVFLFLLALYYFISVMLEPPGRWWEFWRLILDPAKVVASLFGLLVTYLLMWLTFDKENVEGYVLSVFGWVFGLLYILSPVDMIPDAIPFVGGIDDVVIGGGSIYLSVRAWMREELRKKDISLVQMALEDGDVEEALNILLIDKGYVLRRYGGKASQPKQLGQDGRFD